MCVIPEEILLICETGREIIYRYHGRRHDSCLRKTPHTIRTSDARKILGHEVGVPEAKISLVEDPKACSGRRS